MPRIVEVKALTGFRLYVRFSDGISGIYPVEPTRRGGVFRKLCAPGVFEAVRLNPDFGCVEWPEGVDLCPDVMYLDINARRKQAEALPA